MPAGHKPEVDSRTKVFRLVLHLGTCNRTRTKAARR